MLLYTHLFSLSFIKTLQDAERGDEGAPVGNDALFNILLSDTSTADGAETFALLAINPVNDELHGIIEKKGKKPFKISQAKNKNQGKAMAEEETELTAPDWNCDVMEDLDAGESTERKLHDHNSVSCLKDFTKQRMVMHTLYSLISHISHLAAPPSRQSRVTSCFPY
jgi:hypothetical protein